ncbi:hypothetical protein RND71_012135 [Anisodus tanguticus]|uniref:Uncharacterized protein n=1 Tax=Anisodus tanguticus TaxID=243964 RepID=A0AAE1SF98_9SOLA|nr:hypothetical protein RND71_012135 [Anisodus tanguticus]
MKNRSGDDYSCSDDYFLQELPKNGHNLSMDSTLQILVIGFSSSPSSASPNWNHSTDTASVLQEAIENINFLHDQVNIIDSLFMEINKNRNVPEIKNNYKSALKIYHHFASILKKGLSMQLAWKVGLRIWYMITRVMTGYDIQPQSWYPMLTLTLTVHFALRRSSLTGSLRTSPQLAAQTHSSLRSCTTTQLAIAIAFASRQKLDKGCCIVLEFLSVLLKSHYYAARHRRRQSPLRSSRLAIANVSAAAKQCDLKMRMSMQSSSNADVLKPHNADVKASQCKEKHLD